jgi:hypothetical protein
MSGAYALLILAGMSPRATMVLFGLLVALIMWLIIRRNALNQERADLLSLIGDRHHGGGEPGAG